MISLHGDCTRTGGQIAPSRQKLFALRAANISTADRVSKLCLSRAHKSTRIAKKCARVCCIAVEMQVEWQFSSRGNRGTKALFAAKKSFQAASAALAESPMETLDVV
jgi:hypothetical protein